MQVSGTVISVSTNTPVKRKDGGTYPGWELIYKSHDNQVLTEAKHINDLKFKPALAEALKSLSVGDTFTLEKEKDEKSGFYNVLSLVKGTVSMEPRLPVNKGAETSAPSTAGKTTGYQASTYPTADERANTQQYIIRQSSLTNAVATLAVGAKSVNPDDVIKLAERYRGYVNGVDDAVGKVVSKAKTAPVGALEDMTDDIPY
jgi:hypothetical protein